MRCKLKKIFSVHVRVLILALENWAYNNHLTALYIPQCK